VESAGVTGDKLAKQTRTVSNALFFNNACVLAALNKFLNVSIKIALSDAVLNPEMEKALVKLELGHRMLSHD